MRDALAQRNGSERGVGRRGSNAQKSTPMFYTAFRSIYNFGLWQAAQGAPQSVSQRLVDGLRRLSDGEYAVYVWGRSGGWKGRSFPGLALIGHEHHLVLIDEQMRNRPRSIQCDEAVLRERLSQLLGLTDHRFTCVQTFFSAQMGCFGARFELIANARELTVDLLISE